MTDRLCIGCLQPLLYADPGLRIFSDCEEWWLERLASKLDPTYDPTALNTWERLLATGIGKLFPDWTWRCKRHCCGGKQECGDVCQWRSPPWLLASPSGGNW